MLKLRLSGAFPNLETPSHICVIHIIDLKIAPCFTLLIMILKLKFNFIFKMDFREIGRTFRVV